MVKNGFKQQMPHITKLPPSRKSRRERGGVAFFVHEFVQRISGFTSDQCQILTIKINMTKKVFCVVVYSSLGIELTDLMKSLENYLNGMDVGPDDKHVLYEDFNLDHLKHACGDFLNVFNLKRRNNSVSTRHTISSKNCIDVVYSNLSSYSGVGYIDYRSFNSNYMPKRNKK